MGNADSKVADSSTVENRNASAGAGEGGGGGMVINVQGAEGVSAAANGDSMGRSSQSASRRHSKAPSRRRSRLSMIFSRKPQDTKKKGEADAIAEDEEADADDSDKEEEWDEHILEFDGHGAPIRMRISCDGLKPGNWCVVVQEKSNFSKEDETVAQTEVSQSTRSPEFHHLLVGYLSHAKPPQQLKLSVWRVPPDEVHFDMTTALPSQFAGSVSIPFSKLLPPRIENPHASADETVSQSRPLLTNSGNRVPSYVAGVPFAKITVVADAPLDIKVTSPLEAEVLKQFRALHFPPDMTPEEREAATLQAKADIVKKQIVGIDKKYAAQTKTFRAKMTVAKAKLDAELEAIHDQYELDLAEATAEHEHSLAIANAEATSIPPAVHILELQRKKEDVAQIDHIVSAVQRRQLASHHLGHDKPLVS